MKVPDLLTCSSPVSIFRSSHCNDGAIAFGTEIYIQSLRSYIADHPPDSGDSNVKSILEMRFCHYSDFNGFDTEPIKLDFDELYAQMEGLHLRDTVCFLCRKHEKAGFAEGVKVVMQSQQKLKNDYKYFIRRFFTFLLG